MLKFNNKLAFGVKVDANNVNSLETRLFYQALTKMSELVPGFVAEGIGNVARKAEEKVSVSGICTPIADILAISVEKEPRILCVGLNQKYDVSFENVNDIYMQFTYCRLPKVPVYDLKKEFNTVIGKLANYIRGTYNVVEPTVAPSAKVTYLSNYILVVATRVEYGDTETFRRLTNAAPKVENPTSALLSIIYSLMR